MKNSLLLSLLLLGIPIFGEVEDRSNIILEGATAASETVVKQNVIREKTAIVIAACKSKAKGRGLVKGGTGAVVGWHIGWWGTWIVHQAVGVTIGAATTAASGGNVAAGGAAYYAFNNGTAYAMPWVANYVALGCGILLGAATGPTP